MNETANYKLKKPAQTDYYNVDDFNENAETIDTALKDLADHKANLNEDGKLDAAQLPSGVPTSETIGKPGGVASLGEDGKVPSGQLPAMDFVPTSEKGKPKGVASLDEKGQMPINQLPEHTHSADDINEGTLPVERGGTGVTSLDDLAAAMGLTKIATGSYIGTGTYGSSNPNKLTFEFAPKLFVIVKYGSTVPDKELSYGHGTCYMEALTTSYIAGTGPSISATSSAFPYAKKSSDGKTLYWYDEESASYQGNQLNTKYYWIAFG